MVNLKIENAAADGGLPATAQAKEQATKELNLPWIDHHKGNEGSEKVMSIVGCGTTSQYPFIFHNYTNISLGTLASAIFAGMMRKYDDQNYMDQFNSNSGGSALPPHRFILNCSSDSSCDRLKKDFVEARKNKDEGTVAVVQGKTASVCAASDFIMLGCKPYMVSSILGQPGMREALSGKVLVSICAGVTNEDLEKAVYGDYNAEDTERCRFVRVMPNTAAKINESMTVIATPPKPLKDEDMSVVEFLFGCIGKVAELPADKMDAATALAGSGPAFYLLMLEGMIDGAVAMGMPRPQATLMAAQTMKGAAMGVTGGQFGDDARDTFAGTHPAILRDQVTTPGGCTMGGLMVLEEEGVRGSIAKCIRRTTVVASKLGSGAKNVNGI